LQSLHGIWLNIFYTRRQFTHK